MGSGARQKEEMSGSALNTRSVGRESISSPKLRTKCASTRGPSAAVKCHDGFDGVAGGPVGPSKDDAAHCVDLFRIPPRAALREDRERLIEEIKRSCGPDGFGQDALTGKSGITFAEEAAVITFFLTLLLGPMLLATLATAALFGRWWRLLACTVLVTAALAKHPLPTDPASWLARSGASLSLCHSLVRYFSMRLLWEGDARNEFTNCERCVCFCPPHGVVPVAGLLAIPTINLWARSFVGTAASIVFSTPLLRYVTIWGTIEVGKSAVMESIGLGGAVGIIPDGIAGIFNSNDEEEILECLHRRGIAKLALQTGTSVVPCYAFGNTGVMAAWFDRWGIMRSLSRRLRLSLFLPVGRWGLPVPRRANITLVFGRPIAVEKNATPTAPEVEELHVRILQDVKSLFDNHKAALGQQSKKMSFI